MPQLSVSFPVYSVCVLVSRQQESRRVMNSIQYYITKSSIALQPYKALVGQSAAIFSIAQILSPVFMFNSMRKAKSTLGMPFMPFLLIAVM